MAGIIKMTAWAPGVIVAIHLVVLGTVVFVLRVLRKGGIGRFVLCSLLCGVVFYGARRMFPWWWVLCVMASASVVYGFVVLAARKRKMSCTDVLTRSPPMRRG